MKSGISLFNRGIAKDLLRRFWPLWTAYLLALLIMLPLSLDSAGYEQAERWYLNNSLLRCGVTVVDLSFIVAPLSALAVFSYLYNSKSCGLMNSIPVRRETVFTTACLTGLAPLLLADVLTFAVTALVIAGDPYIYFHNLLLWLEMAVMGNVAFYGMAVFCAMLTGSVPVMPAVYAVLNVAAFVAESTVRGLLAVFIYGFAYDGASFTWLSPIVMLANHLNVEQTYTELKGVHEAVEGSYYMTGMGALAAYCAAGVVLLALALLLYRRRQMETAGDVVAVKVLRPVFKYCMAFGGAVVFAVCMDQWVFTSLSAPKAAAVAVATMLVGAFIGYYMAEMLLQKSLSVFKGGWRGFAVTCAVLLLVAALSEFDAFGYEKRVPEAGEVEYIALNFVDGNIIEPENIQAYTALHRQITEHKEQNERRTEKYWFPVNYYLKDGSHMCRIYELDMSDKALSDPGSDIMLWQDICNSAEVTHYRTSFDIPVSADTIGMCSIDGYYYDEEGVYQDFGTRLTTEQALELYNDCIVPDVSDGHLAHFWAIEAGGFYDEKTNTTIYLEVVDRARGDMEAGKYDSMSFRVQTDSKRVLDWIAENTDIEPVPMRRIVDAEQKRAAMEQS